MDDRQRALVAALSDMLRRWRSGEVDVGEVGDLATALQEEGFVEDPILRNLLNDLARAHEIVLTADDVPVLLGCLHRRIEEGDGDGGYAAHLQSIDRAARLVRLRRNPFYPQAPSRCAVWGPRDVPPVTVHDHEGGRDAAIEYFRSTTGHDPDLRGRSSDREIVADRVVRIRIERDGGPSVVEVYPRGAEHVTRIQFWRFRWTGTNRDRHTLLDLLSDWESERMSLDEIEQEALRYRSIIDAPPSSWSPWSCAPWDVMERLSVASLAPLQPIDVPALRAFVTADPSSYDEAIVALIKYFTRIDWDARRAGLFASEAAFLDRLRR